MYYYQAKVEQVTFDEKSGKEKKTKLNYIVEGAVSIEDATAITHEFMKGSMSDYEILDVVQKKNIMDVIRKK